MKKRKMSWTAIRKLTFTFILGLFVLTTPMKADASESGVMVFRNDWETEYGDEFNSIADAWAAIPNSYQGEQTVVIRLCSDQGISEDLNSENFTANVTIDLNGYVLYNEEVDDFQGGFKLHHSSDYTFTICDSSGGREKYFIRKENAGWEWDPDHSSTDSEILDDGGWRGGVIHDLSVLVANGSTCTIRNVLFVGTDTGVTCSHGAYLNLYDDKFYGCAPSKLENDTFGGAVTVYTDDGNADNRVHAAIQGCTFKYNYSPFAGGAIYAGCSIALKDTRIMYNTSYHRGGGIFAGRSFGYVYNSDGCSSDPGGDTARASVEAQKGDEVFYHYDDSRITDNVEEETSESVTSESVTSESVASLYGGLWGDISTDFLSGQEADEVQILIFERVNITNNYDLQYQDKEGVLEPSNVYLRCEEEYCQDFSISRRYVSALHVWFGTEPTFRIGVRRSGCNNTITMDHPDHASFVDGEEPCFFADASENKMWAGYQEAFVEYVPVDGHRYRILYNPLFIDYNGNHYDSAEEAMYYDSRILTLLKSVSIDYKIIAEYSRTTVNSLKFDLKGNNITLINGLATEENKYNIRIVNSNPNADSRDKTDPRDVITCILDKDNDGFYESISESGKPSDNSIPYVQVYGQALVGANEKCGIVSGTESSTDICYYNGIYSFTSPFAAYCENNEYTELADASYEAYICDGKQQFTITIPTSILSHNGNQVYHFGKVSNGSSNSFTLGELAEDGSVTITSDAPWTGRQSFTVEMVSDVVNFESYTLTVYVNSAHDFLADGKNDTAKSACAYCGIKNIVYTGMTVDITNPTYDGIKAKTPEVVVKDGDTELIEGTDYTVISSPETEVGEKDYQLTITGIGTYLGTRTESWNLNKGNPEAACFVCTLPDKLSYDSTAKSVTVAVKSDIMGMGTISSVYYKAAAEGTKLTTTAPTDMGTYKVYVDVNEGQNYKASTNPIEVGEFTITEPVYIIAGYMYDEAGNSVAGDMTGLADYVLNTKATLVAPAVSGYNFVGWYAYDASADNKRTGENVCASRTYEFTVIEDKDLVAVYQALGSAELTIDGGVNFSINGENKSTEIVGNYALGSQVTVVCNSDTFEYWKNSAGMVLSRNKTYTFTVTGKENVKAVYNNILDNQATIVFESYYGQVMARNQYASGATLETEPGLPYRYGYTALGWDYDGDGVYNASKDTFAAALANAFEANSKLVTIHPVYELISHTYTIRVENGTGSGDYSQNDKVTVTANVADTGYKFSHWKDENGTVLSYNQTYQFFAAKDTTVTAVYVEEAVKVEAKGTTEIIETSKDEENHKLIFVSMSAVPEGCIIEKAGIIATDDSTVGTSGEGFNASTAKLVRGNAWTGDAYRYTWTKSKVQSGQTWYVRAYLVYTDAEGNTHTVYGEIVSQTM